MTGAGPSDAPHGESQALDTIAERSDYGLGLERVNTRHCHRVFEPHLRGPSVLELGPADGVMTDLLVDGPFDLTVVEGAAVFCGQLRARHPQITVVQSLFEEFEPSERFDTIVLGHVLEHVADPISLLSRVRHWLAPRGRVLTAVPNADSVHREAAVAMGLLDRKDSLGEADIRHGHRRVYDPVLLRSHIESAGLEIESLGGYWMKPLSNAQIEASWTAELVDAFMEIGEQHPAIAAVITCVAHNPGA